MTLLLYFFSIASLAMAAPLIRWSATPPEVLGLWRLLGASALLFPIAFRRKELFELLRRPNRSLGWIILSAVFFFTHQWTYSLAAQNTKITHCMIIFAINPLFASAGAIYLFKEKISWKWVLAYSLSFLGILQLVKHDFDLSHSSAFGNTSAVLAAVFYAGYVLTGKKARENVSNLSYISFVYFIAGLCFWVAAGFRQDSLIPQTNQAWLSIIGTILIPTLLGHGLFTYLIKRMDLSLMTCGKLMEPMISSLPAFFIFQERPSAETFQAFILTSLGVLVLFFPWQKLIKS